MAGEFPPAPEWVPVVNEDALTRDDARALASAMNGIAEAVGRLNERMVAVEKGAASTSVLSKLGYVSVRCRCGTVLFSCSEGDYEHMDWHTIGKAIVGHVAGHLADPNGVHYTTFDFCVTAYPKQDRR